jgi:hypothetical protein
MVPVAAAIDVEKPLPDGALISGPAEDGIPEFATAGASPESGIDGNVCAGGSPVVPLALFLAVAL